VSRGLVGSFLLLAFAVTASAVAANAISWKVIARGAAVGASVRTPSALAATSRLGAQRIVEHVPPAARSAALALNYRTTVLVGVFGAFGCSDGRVRVARIDERRRVLTIHLVVKRLPPGMAECLALYPTYRLLALPRQGLPAVPTAAKVTVARA
jgi:hypothetical protein